MRVPPSLETIQTSSAVLSNCVPSTKSTVLSAYFIPSITSVGPPFYFQAWSLLTAWLIKLRHYCSMWSTSTVTIRISRATHLVIAKSSKSRWLHTPASDRRNRIRISGIEDVMSQFNTCLILYLEDCDQWHADCRDKCPLRQRVAKVEEQQKASYVGQVTTLKCKKWFVYGSSILSKVQPPKSRDAWLHTMSKPLCSQTPCLLPRTGAPIPARFPVMRDWIGAGGIFCERFDLLVSRLTMTLPSDFNDEIWNSSVGDIQFLFWQIFYDMIIIVLWRDYSKLGPETRLSWLTRACIRRACASSTERCQLFEEWRLVRRAELILALWPRIGFYFKL